jgi:hypothetical protein
MRVRKVTDRDYLESKLALFLTNAHTRAEPPVGSLNGLNPEAYGTQSQPPDKLIAHEHDTSQRLVPEQDPTVHVALPHVLVQPEQSANAVCAMAIPITMVAVPNQLHKILANAMDLFLLAWSSDLSKRAKASCGRCMFGQHASAVGCIA